MQSWQLGRSRCHFWLLVLASALLSQAQGHGAAPGKLFAALDRPVSFEKGIDQVPLERVLKQLGQASNLEFVIDADAFEKNLGKKNIAKWEISFDKATKITTSLFLDMALRQIDGRFDIRAGKVAIIPAASKQQGLYHPAWLPLEEKHRTIAIRSTLKKPVALSHGLDKMTFGEAKQYFEDRFDLSILVDDGLFPESAEHGSERPVRLPILEGVPLETVLEALAAQIGATTEVRGGAVLVVPMSPKK
jgi:hypothetical protein